MSTIKVSAVLLDLGGVIYVGDRPIPGAIEAVARLRKARLPIRFLTNTTRRPVARLAADVCRLGLEVHEEEILAPAALARRYLVAHRLRPYLLVHPDLESEFARLPEGEAEAVVVGDAGERFTYASLNAAFRRLVAGAEFLALAMNRNFRDADGELSLDAGPFVRALEYASGREALVLGKPAPSFFREAVAALGSRPAETAMVGDDVEADVGGAQAAGLIGILVQTGKYRPGDEGKIDPPPAHVAPDLSAAVNWILAHTA